MPEDSKPWNDFALIPIPSLKEGMSLFDFQFWSVDQALQKSTYILGLPTGCGKTLCSLACFFYYRMVFPNTKLIIVTNNSSLFQFAALLHEVGFLHRRFALSLPAIVATR